MPPARRLLSQVWEDDLSQTNQAMVTDVQRVVTSEGRLPRMEQGWEIGTFWKGPILVSLWWPTDVCVCQNTCSCHLGALFYASDI